MFGITRSRRVSEFGKDYEDKASDDLSSAGVTVTLSIPITLLHSANVNNARDLFSIPHNDVQMFHDLYPPGVALTYDLCMIGSLQSSRRIQHNGGSK